MLVKAITEFSLRLRLEEEEEEEEVFPLDSTAAWNQVPSTVHISGPPVSP